MKKFLFIPLFIITLLVMLLLGHYNSNIVEVHWLVIKTQWPLSAIMALMLFSGFIFGLLCALLIGRKHRRQLIKDKQAKQKQEQIEAESAARELTEPTTELAPVNTKAQG